VTLTIASTPASSTVEEIIGDEYIKYGISKTYTIYKYINGIAQSDTYTFSVNNNLVSIVSYTSNTVVLKAGTTVGNAVLKATNTITSDEIIMTITVESLW
jgi:hypothetical protein